MKEFVALSKQWKAEQALCNESTLTLLIRMKITVNLNHVNKVETHDWATVQAKNQFHVDDRHDGLFSAAWLVRITYEKKVMSGEAKDDKVK